MCLHCKSNYKLWSLCNSAFNTPDGRALAISWLGLPGSYPSDRLATKEPSHWSRTHYQDGKLYQYPVSAVKNFVLLKDLLKSHSNNNTYELELNVRANSQSEIVLYADKRAGLSISFDLVNGQVTVDRSQAGEQYARILVRLVLALSIVSATTATIFIDKSVFEIFINKGEKVLQSCLPTYE